MYAEWIGIMSVHLLTNAFQLAGMTSASQAFGLAGSIMESFGYMPFDGVLGLAWPSVSEYGVTPPILNMLPQLDQPLFTIWLDRYELGLGCLGQIFRSRSVLTQKFFSESCSFPNEAKTCSWLTSSEKGC